MTAGNEKKTGITRPRPDGGEIMNKKTPTGIGPRRFSPSLKAQNILRSVKVRAQVV